MGPLCLAAPSLEVAVLRACRYAPLWCTRPLGCERRNTQLVLRASLEPASGGGDLAEAVELFDTLAHLLGGLGLSRCLRAVSAPADMHSVLRPHVDLALGEAADAIYFYLDADLASRTNDTADRGLFDALTRYAEQRLADVLSTRTTLLRVREALAREPLADARASKVARQLELGLRTLHRRLRAEGTSFRGVLDALRMERCIQALQSPTVRTKELAETLGFSESASLHRAFKRWTGTTLRRYHRRSAQRSTPACATQPGLPDDSRHAGEHADSREVSRSRREERM